MPFLRRSCHTVGVVGEQNTPCDVRMQRFEGEFDHWHRVGCVGMCCNPFAMVASEIRTACWFMTIHCTVTGTCKRQGVVTGSVEPWFGLVCSVEAANIHEGNAYATSPSPFSPGRSS